jgi:hypothetical protein
MRPSIRCVDREAHAGSYPGLSDPNFLRWTGKAACERVAADVGAWFLAEQVEDGRDDIERTREPTVARYYIGTFDEKETMFTRVASRAAVGDRTDRPKPRMAQAKRRGLPDNVEICLSLSHVHGILFRAVDIGDDLFSSQEICALIQHF